MEVAASESHPGHNQNPFLEETFYVLSKKHTAFRVKLAATGLTLIKECENQLKTRVIPIRDIIGCRCLRSKKRTNSCVCQSPLKIIDESSEEHEDEFSAYLYIYAYILQNDRSERERYTLTLRFRSLLKYEDNYKEAQKWRSVLKKLMRSEEITRSDYNDVSQIKENPKLLVLLSPKSGSGRGRVLFQKKIAPILQEAEVPYDLHITKYANYAREFVRSCNLFEWSGIVVVGGDGVVFEVINGILERPDWSDVLRHVAIGVVPGGSGNGLARSIAYSCSEPYDSPTLPAALAVVQNRNEPMDLVRVETTSQVMFSFLSIGWGLLSDIDIESESLRVLGGQRFTVWAMARLIGLRTYTGKLYYLPVDVGPLKGSSGNVAYKTETFEVPVDVDFGNSQRRTYISNMEQLPTNSYDSLNEPQMNGPPSQLPPLTSPVPSNWKCLSGNFVMVHASYQTHISSDCLFAPDAKLNDGTIWLIVIQANASRAQILQFLLGLGSGAHANPQNANDAVKIIPVRAFRIEPNLHEQGYLTVDGELVDYGPIQAEVFPALAKVMVP